MKSRIQEEKDDVVSCHWNFFWLTVLFLYCICLSIRKKRFHNEFHIYYYIICDSHERTVNTEKEIFCCHIIIIYANSKTVCVCIVSEGTGENGLLAWPETVLQEETWPPGITHSFLSRTYTVLGTEVCCPACSAPFAKSH